MARVVRAYQEFKDEPGFTRVVNADDIREKDWSLNISLFVVNGEHRRTGMRSSGGSLEEAFLPWLASAKTTRESLATITGSAATDGLLADAQKLKVQLPSWLDRSKWQRFPFGEIADCIREPGQPTPQDSVTYIGLEHMDTGSLHVRRWGSEADLKGQKLKMRKGDILFAKRNAYLRRVAIAPHDGFFSAHGMILRAKPDKVLPEFLPFLMMSDRFMNRAVEISVGSLSPTINWTTLKLETFDLPPLDQQRRIAEILWAVDETGSSWQSVAAELENGRHSLGSDVFSSNAARSGKPNEVSRLGNVCSLIKDGTHQPPARTEEGPLLLGVTNMIDGKLQLTKGDTRVADSFYEAMHKNWQLQPGDVLLAIVGATIGKVAEVPVSFPKFTIQRSVAILRGKEGTLLNRYLRHFLDSKIGQRRIWARVNQTAQPGVYLGEISQIEIPVPPIGEQERIVAQFDDIQTATIAAERHAHQSAELMLCLANQFCCTELL